MANKTSVNIGARLDRLPQSKWHVKIWLVTAFCTLGMLVKRYRRFRSEHSFERTSLARTRFNTSRNVGYNLHSRTALRRTHRRSYRR